MEVAPGGDADHGVDAAAAGESAVERAEHAEEQVAPIEQVEPSVGESVEAAPPSTPGPSSSAVQSDVAASQPASAALPADSVGGEARQKPLAMYPNAIKSRAYRQAYTAAGGAKNHLVAALAGKKAWKKCTLPPESQLVKRSKTTTKTLSPVG